MKKQVFTGLLSFALALTFTLASCSSGTPADAETSAPAATDSAAETTTAPAYVYPDADYKGAAFRVYNPGEMWSAYVHIDVTEMTGEALDDEVYKRNCKVEEKLNFKMKEIEETDGATIIKTASAAVLAGSDDYDVLYIPAPASQTMATSGYLVDLSKLDGLSLDQPWWDQSILESISIKGKTFYGASDMHLMIHEMSWPLFFNEDMMGDLKLELPYGLVREGKWTLDELAKYQKAAARLGSDASYAWNPNGNCVYGISAHSTGSHNFFLYGTGARFVKLDGDSVPYFTADSKEFEERVSKLASILDTRAGLTLRAHYTDLDKEKGGYVYVFAAERAMFLTVGLKGAGQLREYDFTFGIVPFPKYNEAQENYQTSVSSGVLLYTIPVTNKDTSRTAVITDALSYESSVSVKPVYYDITVSQKGLRNENSIEMLDYVLACRGVDLGFAFSWAGTICTGLGDLLFAGDGSSASLIASNKPAVEATIKTYLESMK